MKALIVCLDTRGGVQPYLGLAQRLLQHGHVVRALAPKNYASLFEKISVDFVGMDLDVEGVTQQAEHAGIAEKRFLLAHIKTIGLMKQSLRTAMLSCFDAAQDVDMILGGIGGLFIGQAVAEKLGIPFVQAHVQPWTPTDAFHGMLGSRHLPRSWTHFFTRQIFWQPVRPMINRLRKDLFSLPSAPFWGNVGQPTNLSSPILYGYSPSFLAPPTDWPANIHVTGYWFTNEENPYIPPPRLQSFLEKNAQPISIGFGSMSSKNAKATTALILEALKRTGQRAILLSGWGGLSATELPDNVFLADYIPHSWLFEHVSMAIHHGGAGTTGASLRAGLPTIVVPFNADQPFWGRLVYERGVGPQPIPRRALNAARLADAIDLCTKEPAIRVAAQSLGATIRQEDGVGCAVSILEKHFHGKSLTPD